MSRILILDPKKEVKKELKKVPSVMREGGRSRPQEGAGPSFKTQAVTTTTEVPLTV